jgi:hypothetical protein
MAGDMISQKGFAGGVWTPAWSKAGEVRAETHFRIVGPPTADGKGIIPYRESGEPRNFSHWIVPAAVFKGGTSKFVSFIAEQKDEDGKPIDPQYQPSPAHIFVDYVYRRAKEDPAIKVNLTEGSRGAPVRAIKDHAFVQGILFRHGGKDYYEGNKFKIGTILMLSPSAASAIEEMVDLEHEDYTGDPDDYAARFVHGNIIDADTGPIIKLYNALCGEAASESKEVDLSAAAKGGGSGKGSTEFASYACEIVKPSLPLPRDPDGVLTFHKQGRLFTPWNKALRFLTDQEMVETLVRAYEDHPDVLRAALGSRYGEFLPNFIKGNASVTAPEAGDAQPESASAPTASSTPPAESAGSGDPSNFWGSSVDDGAPSLSPDEVGEQEAADGMTAAMGPESDQAEATPDAPAEEDKAVQDAMAQLEAARKAAAG